MSARITYQLMRHHERLADRLTRLAARNECSSRRDDQFAAEAQGEDAEFHADFARELREELGL